ncbi:MAG: 2-dehydro-3-deoxygalactonokinase [Lautropia sp.]
MPVTRSGLPAATLERVATIGLDWGTSNLRAFLIASDGELLATRQRPWGILSLPPLTADAPQDDRLGRFRTALDDIAGDWLADCPRARAIACGMVGSAQGWVETPYLALPADETAVAAGGSEVALGAGRQLHLVPGLSKNPPASLPDVMRGEETQVVGALAALPDLADALLVLPGTHSKWVRVDARRITDFSTFMTGELFAVLATHSILGRLFGDTPAAGAPADAAQATRYVADEGFLRGIDLARSSEPGDLARQLFAVRSLGLVRQVPGASLRELLSGLLVGHEIVSGCRLAGSAGIGATADASPERPLVVIGEPALCERYRLALARFGRRVTHVIDNPAAAGLHRLATARAARDDEQDTSR